MWGRSSSNGNLSLSWWELLQFQLLQPVWRAFWRNNLFKLNTCIWHILHRTEARDCICLSYNSPRWTVHVWGWPLLQSFEDSPVSLIGPLLDQCPYLHGLQARLQAHQYSGVREGEWENRWLHIQILRSRPGSVLLPFHLGSIGKNEITWTQMAIRRLRNIFSSPLFFWSKREWIVVSNRHHTLWHSNSAPKCVPYVLTLSKYS